jgi:hypothetical protein
MTVDDLVARLEGVRQTAPDRWVARCPAHEDRAPSLSIRVTADGVILVHDFAGCTALDVCVAIGVEYADLFPDRRIRRVEPGRVRIPAAERLELLAHETTTAAIVVNDILSTKSATDAQWQRLAQAAARIGGARHA